MLRRMFGFSLGETILIALIALIAIGPKQLPEVARSLGKMLNELRRASGDFGRTVIDPEEIMRHRPRAQPTAPPQPAPHLTSPLAAQSAPNSPVVHSAPTVAPISTVETTTTSTTVAPPADLGEIAKHTPPENS